MIDTTAITIGTSARNEANTKASTASAPRPPSSASSEHAGPAVAARRVLLQRVEAGQVHRRPGHRRRRAAPPAARFSAFGLSPNGCVGSRRRIGDRERRAAVGGHERAVAGRCVGGDPRAGQGALEPRVDAREVGADAGRVDRLARRQRHDRQQRSGLAAGAA